jgi:hypothetical protein
MEKGGGDEHRVVALLVCGAMLAGRGPILGGDLLPPLLSFAGDVEQRLHLVGNCG